MPPGNIKSNDKIIGVLIADDHPLIRSALRNALSNETDIKVLGEARDGLEATVEAARLNPDVIIMDIYMPKCDGLKALVSIKAKLPDVRVLLLTVSDKEEDLLQALRFGADGYVLKTDEIDVIEAVRKTARGETNLPPYIAQKLIVDLLEKKGNFSLSKRQQEV